MSTAKLVELNQDEMPDGWIASTLGEIAAYIQRGKSPKYTELSELPVVNQKCVRWNGLERQHFKYIHPDQFDKWEEKRFLQNGDLLWNSTGTGTIGRAALAFLRQQERLVVDSHVTIVRPAEGIDPKYVHYWVMGPSVQNSIEAMQSGSTNQVELSKGAVESTPIPVAPFAHQKRIVAKIEELFSHIDAGITALNKAKLLLKQYRQSVLKAAVTGELTKEWREQNKDKLEPASELLERILKERRQKWEDQQLEQFKVKDKMPKNNKWKEKYKKPLPFSFDGELPELPESWVWASPEELASIDDYSLAIGPFGSNLKVSDYTDSGVPLVFVRNIRRNYYGKDNAKYVTESKAEELKAHSISAGDVLITKMGEPPGDASLYPDAAPDAIITADCIKWRFSQRIKTPDLFVNFINSPFIKTQIVGRTKGVAQKKISLATFKSVAFPLPPIEEQFFLKQEVEKRLESIDRLEKDIEERLLVADRNKQSILASAFSGDLVEFKESDGTAQELLKAIEENRQKAKANEVLEKGEPKKAKGKVVKKTILDVLKKKGEISVSTLMQNAGYEPNEVEAFYDDLSQVSNSITEVRPEGEKATAWPYDGEIKLKLK